jgi:DNA replication and repair protein RecF
VRKYKTFRTIPCLNTINDITLLQFRNYSSAGFEFPMSITCITGPNGSGKTNLLDAVYYLCYTKSNFSSYQQHAVQSGKDGFRLEGTFSINNKNEKIACKWKQGKKEISCNGSEYERITDHIGKYAAVMIAPDDLELINGGSELRRKFIDGILCQTDREYFERLMQYQKVLAQRNAWLKMQVVAPSERSAELEYYDIQLAANGTYIHEKRKAFMIDFIPLLQQYYMLLSDSKETAEIAYESDLYTKTLAQWLNNGLEHDLRLQRTLRGIHKDDWRFTLDGKPLKVYASQGQKKSYLFALKLAQYIYLSQQQGHEPILLLDDIFEKLDQSRMEALLRIIRGNEFGQVILTDTHAARVQQAFGADTPVGYINL